ncbi:MAG: DoxX family protein [Halobacteriovoraceae bacterium]|nr:DoxX family protein [Halobacteriovoraceae bacterium]
MKKFLTVDLGLLVFRVAVGLMMIFPHGISKAFNFGKYMDTFADPLGMGSFLSLCATIFAELICSFLIILGVKTRWFASVLLFTMLVAGFVVHASDPWNVKEKAILFAVCYLTLVITGGGKFSVRD